MKTYSEDLRIRVIYDSDSGMPTKAVADKYRVSRSWVRILKQRRRETGSILPNYRVDSPRRRKFPVDKFPELEAFLKEGAIVHGWINEIWTIQRVMELIKSKFNVTISISTVWNILKKDLGWSSIKPQSVLRERDEKKISDWREKGFDVIRRRAQNRGAYLVFADEAGFYVAANTSKDIHSARKSPRHPSVRAARTDIDGLCYRDKSETQAAKSLLPIAARQYELHWSFDRFIPSICPPKT